LVRDDLRAQLSYQLATGQLLAGEMVDLSNGKLPQPPHRWELHEAVGELVVLALTICVTPYEIDPGDAPMKALEDIAVELGFRRHIGATVARSIKEVQARITPRAEVPWGWVLTAAAGVALLAAGPVGLAVATSAGFGAAANTAVVAGGPVRKTVAQTSTIS
jgi:hypothetical protein